MLQVVPVQARCSGRPWTLIGRCRRSSLSLSYPGFAFTSHNVSIAATGPRAKAEYRIMAGQNTEARREIAAGREIEAE